MLSSKPIIACNWTLPNYADLALGQQENLASYGIECINLTDAVSQNDRKIRMYKNRYNYYATKDRAQLDFVRSCRGRYDKVLCLDAEVRCHADIPYTWLSENVSRIWLYSTSFTFNFSKSVNVGEAIWKPNDHDVFQLAIDKAMDLPQGYDIEFTLAHAFHDLSREAATETIDCSRFRHRTQVKIVGDINDTKNFLGHKVIAVEHRGQSGYIVDGDKSSCTNGWLRKGVILTHPSIYPERLRSDVFLRKISIDDLIGCFAPDDHDLALMLYDWLMDHPFDHHQHTARLRSTKRFRSLGSLARNMPAVVRYNIALDDRYLQSEVYEIDGWKICPAMQMIGLPGKWDSNVLIYDTGKHIKKDLWPGIREITDTA